MASPQKENGYIGIANEIWDEVIRRDFTKRQKDILQFIWRLSYGCCQKVAIIPKLKDFSLCGVLPNKIRSELEYLEQCKVIFWNRTTNEFEFNKNYDYWQIAPVRGWCSERYKELVHINLKNSKKLRKKLPETGNDNFPKREDELPEKGSDDDENFPKREVSLPEKGIETGQEAMNDKASESSKDILNTNKKIKYNLKNIYTCEFELFWSKYPRKVRKKEAGEIWERLMKNKVDPALIIQCAENYAAYCEAYVDEERYILHPSTFLNKERYLDYQDYSKVVGSKRSKRGFDEDEFLRSLEEG